MYCRNLTNKDQDIEPIFELTLSAPHIIVTDIFHLHSNKPCFSPFKPDDFTNNLPERPGISFSETVFLQVNTEQCIFGVYDFTWQIQNF